MYLYPKIVRKGPNLGQLDIAVRKPNADAPAEEVVMVYIESGEAKIATSDQPQTSDVKWKFQYSVGPAISVAIEFDLAWVQRSDYTFVPITVGDPWIFRVYSGQLLAQVGQSTMPIVLDTGNITYVSSTRGWKNVLYPTQDQGIVVGYIKDGSVWYVNYCEGPDGNKFWSTPQQVPNTDGASAVSLYRTADFRVGFLVQQGTNIRNIVTTRTWAGLGTEPHYLSVGNFQASINWIQLTYKQGYHAENIVITSPTVNLAFGSLTQTTNAFRNPFNTDTFTVEVDVLYPLVNLDPTDFVLVDGRNRTFKVLGVTAITNIQGHYGQHLILTAEDFNNARDGMKVRFKGGGTTRGTVGQVYPQFESELFMPVGLNPTVQNPPQVVRIINVEG